MHSDRGPLDGSPDALWPNRQPPRCGSPHADEPELAAPGTLRQISVSQEPGPVVDHRQLHEPSPPEWVKEAPYDVRSPLPAKRGTVMKCDFCTDHTANWALPSCVLACPNGAFYMGDVEGDLATNGSEVVRLSSLIDENGAFRFEEDLCTKPRVYYIQGNGERAKSEEGTRCAPRVLRKRREVAMACDKRSRFRRRTMSGVAIPSRPSQAGPPAEHAPADFGSADEPEKATFRPLVRTGPL